MTKTALIARLENIAKALVVGHGCAHPSMPTSALTIRHALADLRELIKEAEGQKHDWKCISPGEYDSLYECRRCKTQHMEQLDRLGSDRPKFGCIGEPK